MRTPIRCILSAAAAGVLAAPPLLAQDTTQAPRTHTVVRGDNLWDLSQRYLGNPFLWPEIYRLNRDVVEDPHWIYPGEVLRLPGDEPVVAERPVPGVPSTVPDTTRPTRPAVDQTRPLRTNVFTRIAPPDSTGAARIIAGGRVSDAPAPTVRPGEVIVAPYMDRRGGPRGFGRILKSADIAGIAGASERFRFQAYDRILISPPVGQVAPEGERYLAYRLGPVLEKRGDLSQVIIPTGIIEVTQAPGANVAAIAKVVRAFTEVSASDRLIPLDTAGIATTVRPVRVPNGPSTTIRWVYGEPVLPSLQHFVVLDVTSNNGIRLGDEFTIYRPQSKRQAGAPPTEPLDPEIMIAKVQVVRSTPHGVTAVVLGQEQPAVQVGMPARISAKMP